MCFEKLCGSPDDLVTERDASAQQAGHILWNSFRDTSIESAGVIRNSVSLDDVTTRDGKISAVRRTFCLLALFDFILIFILWVIYTQLTGLQPISAAIIQQVVHYSFETSLFDIVLLSIFRFVILELSYALYRSSKPWMVALTTFATCVLLLVKVFLFDFGHKRKGTTPGVGDAMDYLLLVISFILAWVETWFLDFKVLRQERKATERLFSKSTDERSPLLNGVTQRYDYTTELYYSPIISPGGSDDEDEGKGVQKKDKRFLTPNLSSSHSRSHSRTSVNTTLGFDEQDFCQLGKEVMEKVWDLYLDDKGWKKEASRNKATVRSKPIPKQGKIFRVEGVVNVQPHVLMEDLYYSLAETPNWNPTVLNAEILQVIDNNTDIAYSVAAEGAGGIVAARDFVQVRRWCMRNGVYVIASKSCEHQDKPVFKNYVRGEHRPGGLFFAPCPENPSKTNFTMIINADLKGWIPQYLIDQALSGVFLEFMTFLRMKANQLSGCGDDHDRQNYVKNGIVTDNYHEQNIIHEVLVNKNNDSDVSHKDLYKGPQHDLHTEQYYSDVDEHSLYEQPFQDAHDDHDQRPDSEQQFLDPEEV